MVKHVTLVLQAEEVEHLAESQYLSIAASKSGHAIQLVLSPKISKYLVAYMAGLVAVSPYKHVLPAESGSVQTRRRIPREAAQAPAPAARLARQRQKMAATPAMAV